VWVYPQRLGEKKMEFLKLLILGFMATLLFGHFGSLIDLVEYAIGLMNGTIIGFQEMYPAYANIVPWCVFGFFFGTFLWITKTVNG
jgi:hypothetical protein